MARKRRRRNRKRRSEASKLVAEYSKQQKAQFVDEALQDQVYTDEQKAFAKRVADEHKAILARTVIVSHVRDLNLETNLTNLKVFLHSHYGPIEECSRHQLKRKGNRRNRGKQYPSAIVRFRNREDAERIFSKSLSVARQEHTMKKIESNAGHKDRNGYSEYITVRPCTQNVSEPSTSITASRLEVGIEELSIGHWFPDDDDVYTVVHREDGDHSGNEDEFLSVATSYLTYRLSVDLEKRTIALKSSSSTINNDNHSFEALVLSLLEHDVHFKLECRFKDIIGRILLCVDQHRNHHLVFRVKQPPKLYKCSSSTVLVYEDSEDRTASVPGMTREQFGSCYAFRLRLSASSVAALCVNNNQTTNNLSKFGILQQDLLSPESALNITVRPTHVGIDTIADRIQGISNPALGFMVHALFDSGKVCPPYALSDKAKMTGGQEYNIFELVEASEDDLAEKVRQPGGMDRRVCLFVDCLPVSFGLVRLVLSFLVTHTDTLEPILSPVIRRHSRSLPPFPSQPSILLGFYQISSRPFGHRTIMSGMRVQSQAWMVQRRCPIIVPKHTVCTFLPPGRPSSDHSKK